MAEMNTIIGDLAAAIGSDSTIDSWSRIEYDQAVSVLENCDPRNEPGQSDCPLVILYPLAKSGGLSTEEKIHIIGVSCAVYDSEMPESLEGVIRFTGARNVETLREHVVDVIKNNIATDLHMEAVLTQYNTVDNTQFPYVSANMEITLTQEKLIGADPFE